MKRIHAMVPGVFLIVFAASCGSGGLADEDFKDTGNVGFGGAQDIGQFRDILDRGEIPGPDTLDANGFFNEHYADLPAADCGQTLCVHGMVAIDESWDGNPGQTVLRVALNTAKQPEDLSEKPMDWVVVVDTSGSMIADERLIFAKQGIDLLIDQAGDNDRIGIVSYANSGHLLAGFGEKNKEELHQVVASLTPDGSTNIYEGLELGMQMAAEGLSVERNTRVILLSDGNITVGPSAEAVVQLSDAYMADGIGLTTIGVGSDFNVGLMRGLAERGAGNFYFLEDPSAVVEVFSEELAFFAEAIALELQIEVESTESHNLGEVLGTRLWNTTQKYKGSMSIPAVFLSSRKDTSPGKNGRRGGGSSLYISMDRISGVSAQSSLAKVRLSYRLPGGQERMHQEIIVDNPVGEALPQNGYVSHLEMRKSYAVYNFFLGLREATTRAQSNYSSSLDALRKLEQWATRWQQRMPDEDIGEDMMLVAQMIANLEARKGAEEPRCIDYCGGEDDFIGGCSSSGQGKGGFVVTFFLLFLFCRPSRTREEN